MNEGGTTGAVEYDEFVPKYSKTINFLRSTTALLIKNWILLSAMILNTVWGLMAQ